MNEHPALEAELEKALREDADGSFLEKLRRSLREFTEAVDIHLREGLGAESYQQWADLQRAAGKAAQIAEETHQLLHEK